MAIVEIIIREEISDDCFETQTIEIPIGDDGVAIVPQGIKKISEIRTGATRIKRLILPEGLREIEGRAFSLCYNIESIQFPDSLRRIDPDSFENCRSLKTIVLPHLVRKGGDHSFRNCKKLESIVVPPKHSYYTSANGVLFNQFQSRLICCPPAKRGVIEIPETVDEIKDCAFDNCLLYDSFYVSSNNPVYTANDGILYSKDQTTLVRCPPTKRGVVFIPQTVVEIEEDAFQNCRLIEQFEVSSDNPAFSSKNGILFNKDQTTLIRCPLAMKGAVEVPSGVVTIADQAFSNCKKIASITLPQDVQSIGQEAFLRCVKLSSIILSERLKEIGPYAFALCGVHSLDVPKSVNSIGEAAFYGSRIRSIVIPEGVKTIPEDAFTDSSLESIEIAEGVKSIGSRAFRYCRSLRSIVLPESLENIGSEAFESCKSLVLTQLPKKLRSIEERAFKGCSSLTTIELSKDTLTISPTAFTDCDALNKFVFSTRLIGEAEDYAGFLHVGPMKLLDDQVDDPEEDAPTSDAPSATPSVEPQFSEDGSVLLSYPPQDARKSYEVPDGVKRIARNAFAGAQFESIVLPSTLETIKSGAFRNCANLQEVVVPEGVEQIESETFLGCDSLQVVRLPRSLQEISGYAFANCASLREVHLFGDATIDPDAFDASDPNLVLRAK